MNNILYIGLNGYAGAGKDTVAKILKTILSKDWENIDQCKDYYFKTYTNPTQSATYNPKRDLYDNEDPAVLCIAYADQLKEICSKMFGIPRQRWYQNKSTAWICINDKFQYTEIKPDENNIITADDYYYSVHNEEGIKYWMSLREVLVYVGTYVLQSINRSIFVNIVRNYIKEEIQHNSNLKYVIVTDNRFVHELDFIHENNGITMTISRDTIQQLDNIAEHDLDDEEDYDYNIDNSGSYDDLFEQLWNITHNDIEFKNITINLYNRDNVNNYLRLYKESDDVKIYKLCAPMHTQQLWKSNGDITAINPVGGPMICLNEKIDCHDNIIPIKIEMNDYGEFLIYTYANQNF